MKHFLITFVGVFALPLTVFAANITWDGGGGDNNWSTADNWSGDAVPGTGDILTFNSTTYDASIVDKSFAGFIGGLTLDATFTGSIILNQNLTVYNALTLAGGTLNAGCSGNILTVFGDWNNTGSTFSSGTGTILLRGTGSSTNTITETSPFYDITIGNNNNVNVYYKFDDGPGSSTVTDSSLNDATGTLTNMDSTAAWSSTLPGDIQFSNSYSLSFDGVDDSVNLGSKANISGTIPYTVATWIKTSASALQEIYQQRAVSGGVYQYSVSRVNADGTITFIMYKNGVGYGPSVITTDTVNDGDWHHVALRRDVVALKQFLGFL